MHCVISQSVLKSRVNYWTLTIILFKLNNHNWSQWFSPIEICPIPTTNDVGWVMYSLSGKTSYCQVSWSLEAVRFDVILIVSFWNLTGISVALLPMCSSNIRPFEKVLTRISRLRYCTWSCGKTSAGLVNRGPGVQKIFMRVRSKFSLHSAGNQSGTLWFMIITDSFMRTCEVVVFGSELLSAEFLHCMRGCDWDWGGGWNLYEYVLVCCLFP